MKILSDKDVQSGLMFLLIGVFGLALSNGFDFGSTAQPGPGFFPIVLSSLLVIIGLGVICINILTPMIATPKIVWRPFLLITLAVVVFATGVDRFGLMPSVLAAALTASFAKTKYGTLSRVLMASALAIVSAVLFIVLLRLPIALWSF